MRPKSNSERAEILSNSILRHAPENELGVAFLFAELAKRWRLHVDVIKASFPDCIAYQKTGGRERRIRIEFEYKSRNFKTHGHDAKQCDWIVCWENDWTDAPKTLHIVELRKEFDLGFNVWLQPINDPFKDEIRKGKGRGVWSAASQAHRDDLVLFYLTRPDKCIKSIGVLKEHSRKRAAVWKRGRDNMADVRHVCILDSPVFLEDLRRDRILSTAPFLRSQLQGRPRATEYWPYLYEMIIKRNPSLKKPLHRFAPANL